MNVNRTRKHAALCHPCASKRYGFLRRLTAFVIDGRCDACRRPSKLAECYPLSIAKRGK